MAVDPSPRDASTPEPAAGRIPTARSDLASLRIDRSAAPRRRSRAPLVAAIVLTFLLGAGAITWLLLGGTPEVRVAYAVRQSAQAAPAAEVLTGSGYVVTADRYISLGVRVPARILEYPVEEGESVEAGDVLVRLDARQYEAAIAESRAALAHARADSELRSRELERTRELFAKSAASQADLDLKRNQVAVAAAEIERLSAQIRRQQIDLDDTVIRAPTSGVILEKLKEVGEIAVPGGFQGSGDLVRMANLRDLRVELDVNEGDLARITLGQPVRVVPEAYPDRTYDARVVKLYPQINRQKGTLKVEAQILEPDASLRPDMSARITFLAPAVAASPQATGASGETSETGELPGGVVLVPRAALRRDQGETFAWVVTQGRARRQPIEIAGPGPEESVIVTRGLAGGEAVVVGDVASLRDGGPAVVSR